MAGMNIQKLRVRLRTFARSRIPVAEDRVAASILNVQLIQEELDGEKRRLQIEAALSLLRKYRIC